MQGQTTNSRERNWFASSNNANSNQQERYEMADAFRKFNDTISKKRMDNRQTPITPLETNSNNSFFGRSHNFHGESNQRCVPNRFTVLLRQFVERTSRPRENNREQPKIPKFFKFRSKLKDREEDDYCIDWSCLNVFKWWDYEKCTTVIDPEGSFHMTWLLIMSACFTYNAWVIPLRSAFPYQTQKNTPIWLIFDAFCDLFYLIDVAIIKPRITFLKDGFLVNDPRLTKKNYMKKLQFKLDLISLFPVEIFYFYFGTSAVLLRLPRLLKIQTFLTFYRSLDRIFSSPYIVRIGRSLSYMLYLIHVLACAYYKMSTFEGIASNGWVFNGIGHPYLRCFYFATKVATSIGKNPKPENEMEYIFMTISWMMGVFVFALMIGQIRDIIATVTRVQMEYRNLVDETKEYMQHLNIENDVQQRITSWFDFTWEQQRSLDEAQALNALPINLKTDVAINVHIQTLSKVQLFNDCDEALLRDLVLKLKAVIYLPGDLVCRKGDVGREMYIIKMGQVQVMGGENNDQVLVTLSEGSVFGEISLLAINGLNRRTADVRSKGYSNLFVLDKEDLNSALQYYPEAQELLKRKAKALIKKNSIEDDSDGAEKENSSFSSSNSDISTISNSSEEADNDSSSSSSSSSNDEFQDRNSKLEKCYCDKLRGRIRKNSSFKRNDTLLKKFSASLYKTRDYTSEPCLKRKDSTKTTSK